GFGVLLLLLYWLPVTFIVHSFWNDPEPEKRLQAILFMKNIAVVGGLLMVWVNGSGRFSIRRLFATTRVPGSR
ncbi:MAG: DoxX family protein, partial [Saprospiraceae bacterium]|nr:DoxX family protein [Saprospiraceae bacterium]MCB0681486.1 DoxX family protein [Saprospiraceae bacterium]